MKCKRGGRFRTCRARLRTFCARGAGLADASGDLQALPLPVIFAYAGGQALRAGDARRRARGSAAYVRRYTADTYCCNYCILQILLLLLLYLLHLLLLLLLLLHLLHLLMIFC